MKDIPVVLNLDSNKNESNAETTRAINALKNCMEMLLESQDRVDISLSEYENLKKTIAQLHRENEQMHAILDKLGFSLVEYDCGINVIDNIVPGSIRTSVMDPFDYNPLCLKRRVRIEFDIER